MCTHVFAYFIYIYMYVHIFFAWFYTLQKWYNIAHFFFFGCARQLVWSYFPDQGLNPGPRQWKPRVLTTGLPRNFPWYLKEKNLVFFLDLSALFTFQSPLITAPCTCPGVIVVLSGRDQMTCACFNFSKIEILVFIFQR